MKTKIEFVDKKVYVSFPNEKAILSENITHIQKYFFNSFIIRSNK